MHTVSRFLRRVGWKPDAVASFAGSIAYLRYRWLMRLIWRYVPLPDAPQDGRSGGLTDDDYAFTDWEAVNRFATMLAAVAKRRTPQPVRSDSTPMKTASRAHGSIAV
jgi:menaquinone-dependent protoporphyrinogen IX oxidase